MPAELDALLGLQARDRAAKAVRDEIAAFEPELAALDQAIAEAARDLERRRREIGEAGEQRTTLEEKIENFKAMQERKRQRLEWVRGAKEASNLMAELDLGRSVLAKEESEWVRSADRVQDIEAQAAEAEVRAQDMQTGQQVRRDEIAALIAEARQRLATAEAERATAAKAVSVKWLRAYERILQGRAPHALYPLHADSCGQCFTAVPKHRRQELLNGVQLITCEACGVLVYEPSAAPEVAEVTPA